MRPDDFFVDDGPGGMFGVSTRSLNVALLEHLRRGSLKEWENVEVAVPESSSVGRGLLGQTNLWAKLARTCATPTLCLSAGHMTRPRDPGSTPSGITSQLRGSHVIE